MTNIVALPMGQHQLTALQYILRLSLGAALGVAIGLERQRRQSAAGVHTTSLVATGAALFAMIEPLLSDGGGQSRVLANIVTGVGFLAGGVILRDGTNVRGLNTAATIWATAAVGALAGVGLYTEAALGAVVIIALNMLMEPVIKGMARFSRPSRESPTVYTMTISCTDEAEEAVRSSIVAAVSDSALTLQSVGAASSGDGRRIVTAELVLPTRDDAILGDVLTRRLAALPGVQNVSWSAREV
jgi:putative Mg2+ transporter-C (MgtC) family protein